MKDVALYVPGEMGGEGRFAVQLSQNHAHFGLFKDYVCVFQEETIPTHGKIIAMRFGEETKIGVAIVLDDFARFYYDDNQWRELDGEMLGFLVGIVRERNGLRLTAYNPSGIERGPFA